MDSVDQKKENKSNNDFKALQQFIKKTNDSIELLNKNIDNITAMVAKIQSKIEKDMDVNFNYLSDQVAMLKNCNNGNVTDLYKTQNNSTYADVLVKQTSNKPVGTTKNKNNGNNNWPPLTSHNLNSNSPEFLPKYNDMQLNNVYYTAGMQTTNTQTTVTNPRQIYNQQIYSTMHNNPSVQNQVDIPNIEYQNHLNKIYPGPELYKYGPYNHHIDRNYYDTALHTANNYPYKHPEPYSSNNIMPRYF